MIRTYVPNDSMKMMAWMIRLWWWWTTEVSDDDSMKLMYKIFRCVVCSDGFFKQPHQVSLNNLLQRFLDTVVIPFDEDVWWWRESLSEANTLAVMKIQMKIWTFLLDEDASNSEDALKIEALYRCDAPESWMKKL